MQEHIFYHEPNEAKADLSDCIARHTADALVAYKRVGETDLTLGIYYPVGYRKGKTYPLFVLVHGGGWASRRVFADQNTWAGDYLGFLARYYAEKGYFAVSIDYRLLKNRGETDGFGLIDLYEDCFDAMDYLYKSKDEYGMDFSNATVLGESAGGHLAAALATFDHKGAPLFERAILVNPITDLSDKKWTYVPGSTNHPDLKDFSFAERVRFLSPVAHIGAQTCPTLLLHGAADTVVDVRHSADYHGCMLAKGRSCQLHYIKDTDHAFLLTEYMAECGQAQDAASTAIAVIDRWLQETACV